MWSCAGMAAPLLPGGRGGSHAPTPASTGQVCALRSASKQGALSRGRSRLTARPARRAAGNDTDLAVVEFEIESCAGGDRGGLGDDARDSVANHDIAARQHAFVAL